MTSRSPSRRLRRTAVLAAAGSALVAQTALATAAQAALPEPDASACRNAATTPVATSAAFNDIVAGRRTTVVESLCSLIKQAPSGSTLRFAEFVISGDAGADFVAVLLDAHRRGVRIQAVMDGYQIANPSAQALLNGIGTDTSAGSWVHVCSHMSPEGNTTSCQGTKGMHNKFYLFSETGGRTNVVVQASNNVTDVNSKTYWNNALTVTGNEKLYHAYGQYFDDLVAEVQTPDYYRTVNTGMNGGKVTAHFFPSATVDPVVERLNGVGCKTDGRTAVEVGMSEWDDTRVAIAERLAELAAAGCRVRVVHGPTGGEVLDALDTAGVQRRVLDGSTPAGRVHSKYLVVNGATGSGGSGDFVLTGSHNYNHTSLSRNDEALIDISAPDIVDAYTGNFNRIWEVAAAPQR